MSTLPAMRVGVLGSGEVGRALARGFADRGHDVLIGSRGQASEELATWLEGPGAGVKAGTFAETAGHGDPVSRADERVSLNGAVLDRLPGPGDLVVDAARPRRRERADSGLDPFVAAVGTLADAADTDPGGHVAARDRRRLERGHDRGRAERAGP